MFRNRQIPRRRRHQGKIMDNHMPRKKFWFVFFVLFFLWYLLLYGSDWSSFTTFSSISHNQDNPLQSVGSTSTNPTLQNVTIDFDVNHTSNYVSKNATIVEYKNHTESINVENDAIEDLEGLEKELEPILPQDDEERKQRVVEKPSTRKSCTGRYIYMHDLPTRFNDDYIKQCKLLNKWHDMCQYFVNSGLGNPIRLFSGSGWYVTHQFSLDVIFHHRMKQYECLTNDSSKAAAIYVPYYPGLDVSRYLWDYYNTSIRDTDALELYKWLRGKPEWDKVMGMDHFLVTGRITWDLRRGIDSGAGSEWGSKLMMLPESQNMTMVTIESSPWDKNDFAVPYPTYFHPSSEDQIFQWQNRMRKQRRRSLFCFAGAPRPNMKGSIRDEIMKQCTASNRRCKLMECKNEKHNCLKPANVMRMFQSSVFSLQPPGDSFTRRSTFDSILAGCIPVFFTPGSAYVQYLWHLPKDYGSYSVLISEEDVKQKKVNIESVLSRIPKEKVAAMREVVIKLIPKVIYARTRLEKVDDAFDLAVRGVIERIDGLKREMREGRNFSKEFDAESSWKYYTFGTTKQHEWDHYFKRHK
ncbi:hypothetical protein BUALT_Bualt02G0064300 [Buddleja alternifolia]|uniref:Exostosin GT47 domain-containing protein n=1 Tax=Buddleja alternifolia TaxID=168488 RepID=A0AAV6Y4B8_9LAMI|nr:hypothetical protein BUALT_Bualt02G0064300 [Buddleja alternifolia]